MSYNIAVIIETMNTYGRGIIRGIGRSLRNRPACTLFYEERTLDSPPPTWLKTMKGDGIIVRDRTGKSCRIALATGAHVVDLSENRHPGVPTVISNHVACSQLAAQHLIEKGFAHFGYVGIQGRPFSDRRRDAFLEAVGNAHLFELPNDDQAFSSWGSDYSKLTDWLKKLPKPIGILACYDMPGVGVLQACRLAGINVPDTVAVIGINNDELQCSLSTPPLSSVAQNQERLGFEACELLFRLIEGGAAPRRILEIDPIGVVARRSTDIVVMPDRLIARAIGMIRERACEGIGIAEIAESLGMSRRTFERRFYKAVKLTPHEEITATRLKRACELLVETSLPLRTVAKRIGLASLAHFTEVFVKKYGVKPSEYRRGSTSD